MVLQQTFHINFIKQNAGPLFVRQIVKYPSEAGNFTIKISSYRFVTKVRRPNVVMLGNSKSLRSLWQGVHVIAKYDKARKMEELEYFLSPT